MSCMTASRPRCLLILPRGFYSFAKVLTGGLTTLGFDTTVANDEYPESLFGKIISKLGLSLSHAITRRVLLRQVLDAQQYDLILVIKGRGLDASTASLLTQHGRCVVGYHFDAFRFDSGPSRWRVSVPRVCTFDYRDAEEHGLPVVELFTSIPPVSPSALTTPRRYRVSAIQRNHSQRLAYLDRVLGALGGPGGLNAKDTFIYLFEANALTFLVNFMRHPWLYLKYRHVISRKPLPYEQYVAAIAESDYTIDYAHPKQTGITIRCFEALSAGTRLITNNLSVMRSPYFTSDNALVYERNGDAASLRHQLAGMPRRPPNIRRRTVDDFLRDLIGQDTIVTLTDPSHIEPAKTQYTQ